MSESQTEEGQVLATHGRGKLSLNELNERIEQIWSKELGSKSGRQDIAEALGVKPQDLKKGDPPIRIEADSGIDPTLLHVIGDWALTTVVVPALIGLAQEETKKRLARLWKEVLLPAIRGNKEDAIN